MLFFAFFSIDVQMKRSGSMPKMSGFLGREKRKSNYKQGSQIDVRWSAIVQDFTYGRWFVVLLTTLPFADMQHQEMPGMGSDSAESPSTPRKKDKKDKKKDKDKEVTCCARFLMPSIFNVYYVPTGQRH